MLPSGARRCLLRAPQGHDSPLTRHFLAVLWLLAILRPGAPAVNPFGTPAERRPNRRDDAVPGYLETSDGKVHPGQVSLTRDAKLKIYDEERKRHREVPLKAIERIDCTVLKEWDREGMAVQGERQRREVLHRPDLPRPRIRPHDHSPEPPDGPGDALGHRLRPGGSGGGPRSFPAPQARQGRTRYRAEVARLRPVDPARGEGVRRGQAEGVRRDGGRVEAPEHREE